MFRIIQKVIVAILFLFSGFFSGDNSKNKTSINFYLKNKFSFLLSAETDKCRDEWGKCISGNYENSSGIYVSPFGKYEGEFKEGKKHGSGTFTWKEGEVYTGQWKNDKMHGSGILYYNNGTIKDGKWANDKFITEK